MKANSDKHRETEEIRSAIIHGPADRSALIKLARCAASLGRGDLERDALAKLALHDNLGEMLQARLVALHLEAADHLSAVLAAKNLVGRHPGPRACCLLSRALVAAGHFDDALECLQQATSRNPNTGSVWRESALLQRRMGLTEASQASFKRVLEIDPSDFEALRIMGYEHRYQTGDFNFQLVSKALENPPATVAEQIDVHYAAAKAFEDLGHFETAFGHFTKAGALQKTRHPWSEDGLSHIAAALQQSLTKSTYETLRQDGFPSERPVFVIGMPRSGTTLIEQILSNHPAAHGAGELKLAEGCLNGVRIGASAFETTRTPSADVIPLDATLAWNERGQRYVDRLSALAPESAARIVDKMPGNYLWAGPLSALLPASRFIHCRRHPIDCCLSQFKLHFGDEIPYSYDLRDLGRAYRIYHDVMQAWSRLLPYSQLMHIRYEDVVRDLEGSARRLMKFVDLPWDDACLAFEHSSRSVQTASAAQVRKPIYRHAVGAWRKYEKFLQPLLDEIGDLAEAYEHEVDGVRV